MLLRHSEDLKPSSHQLNEKYEVEQQSELNRVVLTDVWKVDE